MVSTLVPIQTGFRVLPRGLPDGRVRLHIAPVTAEEEPQGRVVRASATTEIIVTPGEVVVIASVQERVSEISVDPFASLDLREGTTDTVMLVTVERLSHPTP